jgi:chemotaxis protein methyltransferase CheR
MNFAKKLVPPQDSNDSLDVSTKDFGFVAKKIYELAGVHLPDNQKNRALVKNRLSKLMKTFQKTNISSLVVKLQELKNTEMDEFVSALTTNKTDFFREKTHFDFLTSQLKNHFDKERELKIWCAAASTGQEPYTLAMVCSEILTPAQMQCTQILATDIDLEALQKGVDAVYTKTEIAGIPMNIRSKYLGEVGDKYRMNPALSEHITFCPFNLIRGPYSFNKPFHFVFCRNVLIYFDEPTINKVVDGLISTLVPKGFLFLGQSESGVMKSPSAKSHSGAVFQRCK